MHGVVQISFILYCTPMVIYGIFSFFIFGDEFCCASIFDKFPVLHLRIQGPGCSMLIPSVLGCKATIKKFQRHRLRQF